MMNIMGNTVGSPSDPVTTEDNVRNGSEYRSHYTPTALSKVNNFVKDEDIV